MKTTLVALAAAGVLASGAAIGATVVRVEHGTAFVPVQYGDRWDDRSVAIDEREARINARIQRGLHDGRITDREGRHLYRELHEIRAKERAFKSDGRLGRRESEELNRDLDRLADHVRSQLRDEQRRY